MESGVGVTSPFVKLFGRPRLLMDGRELALTPLQVALIGLVYGHTREGLSRSEVASLLWESGPEDVLRRRLSQLLYALSQEGADKALLRAGDIIGRSPTGESDLNRLHEHLSAGRFHEAAALVEAGFLDVLPTIPTREYQTWLDSRSSGLRRLIRTRASKQWALAEGQGQWSKRALSAAQALYQLDPRSESAMRNVMWAQALCSSPTEALGTYDAFFDVQAEEPSTPPTEATRILLQRVRSLARQKSGTAHAVRSGPPEPTMYGREATVAEFRPLLFEPEEDCLTTVAISGEAGLGKTRLLNESLSAATLQGRLVLKARLAELEKDVALNALTEALSTREVAEVLSRVEEPWRSVVLQFLPEFARVSGGPVEVPEIQRDSVHRRLLESLRQIFIAIAERHSFVLVLDDCHWIDDSSLAALEYVRRRWRKGAGTIVVTYRPEHVTPGSKLDVFLGASGVRHLKLQPLDQPSQKQLIRELSGEDLAQRSADRIVGLARGNPLFLIELTRQWMEGGTDPLSEVSGELSVPGSIRRLFDRRLSSLPDESIRVLEALSVWGRVASLSDLEHLTESTADQITIALEHLDRAGLVRWTAQGTELWHELLRQSVLGRISGARRQLLHRRVADALMRRFGEAVAGEVALHSEKAGLKARSFKFGGMAAGEAETRGALREAIVLHGVCTRNAPDEEARLAALIRQAELECRIWEWPSAMRRLNDALPELSPNSTAFDEVHLLLLVARANSGEGSREEISREFDDMLRRLREKRSWETLAIALDAALHHFELAGDLEQHIEHARSLIEDCKTHGPPIARCIANRLQVIEAFCGSLEIAARGSIEAIKIAESAGLEGQKLRAYSNHIVVLICGGRLHQPQHSNLVAVSLRLAQRSGDPTLRCGLLSNLGAYYTECGEPERARSYLTECLSLVPESRFHPDTLRVFANVGELEIETRDFHSAREWFARCLDDSRSDDATILAPLVGLGLCALELGRIGEAISIAGRCERMLERRPFSHEISYFYKLRAEIALRQGRPAEAISNLRRAGELSWGRRTTVWLRSQLWLCRLLRRLKHGHLEEERIRGLRIAESRDLGVRAREFRALKAS